MSQGMKTDWQKRRSEFNHDWLKNEFFRHLSAFVKRLESSNPDPARLTEFINEDLSAWERRRADAQWLLATFETEMSPARLFRQSPLKHARSDTKTWLSRLVHELWKVRHPVEDWLKDTQAAFAQADDAYTQIKQTLRRNGGEFRLQLDSFRDLAVLFRDRCSRLNSAMSEFPSEIKVV